MDSGAVGLTFYGESDKTAQDCNISESIIIGANGSENEAMMFENYCVNCEASGNVTRYTKGIGVSGSSSDCTFVNNTVVDSFTY